MPNATTTEKGIAELITKNEVEKPYDQADTTRIVPAKRVHDLLRHSVTQATTLKRGTVKFADGTQAQDEDNDTHALTAASLYRKGTFFSSGDISAASQLLATLSNLAVLDATQKYFGPMLYDEIIEITGRYQTTSASSNVQISLPASVTLEHYTWSVISTNHITGSTPNPRIDIHNGNLRISSNTSTYDFKVTGTPI